MRLLVCGSQDYDRRDVVASAIADTVGGELYGGVPAHETEGVLIHSGSTGAGAIAVDVICHYPLWTVEVYPAYGRRAGPIRNQRMIDVGRPDFALVFPGGRGTKDMMNRLFTHGVPFRFVGRCV